MHKAERKQQSGSGPRDCESVRKGKSPCLGTEQEPIGFQSACFLDLTALSGGLLGGSSSQAEVLGKRRQGNAGCLRQRKPDLMPGVGQSG